MVGQSGVTVGQMPKHAQPCPTLATPIVNTGTLLLTYVCMYLRPLQRNHFLYYCGV